MTVTCASIAVTLVANSTAPSSWKPTQPATILSVFELFMILLTACALFDGIAIAFWTRLLNGTTIAKLYDLHEASTPWSAMRTLLRLKVDRVAIATVCAVLSLARGPLFQWSLELSLTASNSIDDTPTLIYTTTIPTLIIATLFSLLSILAIIPLFQNYHLLGRQVSLNPLEIARAFGAPLFEGVDGNATALDVEMERGTLEVRYGAVERSGREKVLRVEDFWGSVRRPRAEEVFG